MQEYEFTGKAMGTSYAISIVCDSQACAEEISEKVITDIQAYEKRFSRFLPDSELTELNNKKDLIVSKEFMTVTQKAYALFVKTKGFFNPLVQIERKGYDKDFSKMNGPISTSVADEKYDIDFNAVILQPENMRIILNEGQKLDFGGFLKGYLAEVLCKKVMAYSPSLIGAIVNIGGDIHTQGVDEKENAFTFDIYNPVTQEEIPVTLKNQSLATSGTYKRMWMQSDIPMHHILDSTGLKNSDSGIVSSSVIGDDGGMTEAYAKVFLNLGEAARETLSEKNISFLIIKQDGTVIKNLS